MSEREIAELMKKKKTFTSTVGHIAAACELIMKFMKEDDIPRDDMLFIIYNHQKMQRTKKTFKAVVEFINEGLEMEEMKIEELRKQSELFKERYAEYQKLNTFIQEHNVLKKAQKLLKEEKKKEIGDSSNIEEEEEDDKLLKKKRKPDGENPQLKDNSSLNPQQRLYRFCYICKENFTINKPHFFYSNLCNKCGTFNYSMRSIQVDLTGRIALVTGGRVKIGYAIVTKLLSFGAKVILTTRFPVDCLKRFQKEEDYKKWKNNLIIYPIDFRFFESTIKFVKYLNETQPHLDIIINNAAQSIRRDHNYYKYLLPIESTINQNKNEDEDIIIKNEYVPLKQSNLLPSINMTEITKEASLPLSVIASQIPVLPSKKSMANDLPLLFDSNDQPHDFSLEKSSWHYELDEIPFEEFIEVQIINAWTPYYFNVALKPLLMKSPFKDKYIINVSSNEGLFNTHKKSAHPHTNMAKASLNMLTRTCGKYYKNYGIYMTCVDTGWVSSMTGLSALTSSDKTKRKFEKELVNIPLDEIDGAMRVLHPVIEGVNNKNYLYGCFLKDYKTGEW